MPESPTPIEPGGKLPRRQQRKGGAHRKHTPGGQVFMGVAVAATMIGLVLIVVGLVGMLPSNQTLPASAAAAISTDTVAEEATISADQVETSAYEATSSATSTETSPTAAVASSPVTAAVPVLASATDARLAAATARRLTPLDISRYLGRVVRKGSAATGMVAVTFDDGPSANTELLLRELKAADARATFFFVGVRALGREAAVRDTLAAGSEIGNHTYTHKPLRGLTFAQFDAEVGRTQRALMDCTGYSPKVVRPFGGEFDAADLAYAARTGLVLVDWNVHTSDTVKGTTSASIRDQASRAPAGSIILLHETRKETVEAFPAILAKLKARGLKLVTVSELLSASSH